MRKAAAAVLSLIVATVCAQEVPIPPEIANLRLLPPTLRAPPPGLDLRTQLPRMPVLVRERHPEVFDKPVAGTYLVLLLVDPEGRPEKSTATEVERNGVDLAMRTALAPMTGATVATARFQKDTPLPDGSTSRNDVVIAAVSVPSAYDDSRAVSRVHDAVRRSHSDLLLPGDGPILNRFTVLMNEDGSIRSHVLEQSRREDLRRAPLEDSQFAERMAARIANVLSVDPDGLGVVGFTYVVDTNPVALQPGKVVMPATVLVQYAWPRKPGETGPSAPMTSNAQQPTRNLDERMALRLAEHYFPDAFTNTAPGAGTPTIALSPQGQVIAAGRVQYGSGLNHERLISEQLVPGIQSAAFVSPRLTNAAGQSAVVSFVWAATN